MKYNKNDIIETKIDAYGSFGEAVAHPDGYTLFVNGALIGERVRVKLLKAKKTYGYAKLLEVLESSPERVVPKCPVADKCGGCDLQHMSYAEQLRLKTEHVRDCLIRLGRVAEEDIDIEVLGGEDAPTGYRNKAQFPVGLRTEKISDKNNTDNTKIISGFYAKGSHRITDCDTCLIQSPVINKIKGIVIDIISRFSSDNNVSAEDIIYDERTHRGWLRHIYVREGYFTARSMLCLVVNEKYNPGSLRVSANKIYNTLIELICAELIKRVNIYSLIINYNNEKSNVVLGKNFRTVYGEGYIEDEIGGVRFKISPESFYQVNPHMTKKLYEKALEYADLSGSESVWDLYCGIGTISLFLAKGAGHVLGVEIVEGAVENARENAAINNINNAEFICGTAESVAADNKLASPDIIVLDPPRKGCDERLINTIGKVSPNRIVYVSCDPATLARDINRLSEFGYSPKKVCVVDQFINSRHVETIVQLEDIHS